MRKGPLRIIGLCGGMKSGKSTVAQLFSLNHENVKVMSFATGVRCEVARGMGLPHTQFITDFDKETIRPLLQAWGQEMRNIMGEDYWIRLVEYRVNEVEQNDVVIIDDVRYLNECAWIIENGGVIIRLDCDEDCRINRGANDDEDSLRHPSEVALDGFSSYLATVDTSAMPSHEVYAHIHQVLNNVGFI